MDKHFTHIFLVLPVLLLFSYLLQPFFAEAPEPVVQAPEPDAAVAEQSMPPCSCTVTQGDFTSPLPFLSSNTSAVDFYDYGNPLAASANTGLEMSQTMLIMLYEDLTTTNTSLIIILDEANDGSGGNGEVTFNCLPPSAFVEFSDDAGELAGTPPTITGNFNWAPCCTDGGIIGGVGCGHTFTINPDLTSGITLFSLVYGTPSVPTYVDMPQLNCPITINCGGTACCQEAFEFSATTQNASCENSQDGMIDLTTDCATTPIFVWSNGEGTEDLFGLNPGTYTVTITDANGCSEIESYIIDPDNPSPNPSIIGPTEFCAGEPVELSVDGNYSTYLWSNGNPSSTIFVTTPGTYTVTVSNGAGCTGTASTTLVENPVPEPDIMGPTGVCIFYDTIMLDAGAGFVTYQWSSGESTQSIEVTEFGSYFVTVTNSFGCSAFDFTIVEPLANPFPEITGPTSICEGNPIILDASGAYISYQWSTGDVSPAIVTSTGGTYSVTVTNTDDCIGMDSHEVTEVPADSILLFQSSCNPLDTGVFIQNLTNQYGCDSVEILTVDFSQSDSIFLYDQSCNPQDTGIFIQTYTNQYGCDSVEIETVTLLPADSLFLMDSSCSPLDTGTFVLLLTNQFGCDSLVTTTTVLLSSDTVQLFAQSCDPANAGVTEELFVNSNGCDSLVITTTSFILVDTTYLTDSSCDPQMTGVFEDLYTGSDGCDSLVITTVDLLLSDTTYLEANSCDLNQAGQSEELLSNQEGCDSLVITNTTFIPADTTLLFSESCDPGATGVFENVLANIFGCDSVVITTVGLLPTDTTALFETSCDPAQSGVEEILLTNQFGCDSLVVTTTTYSFADSTQINNTTCDPSAAGIFVEILVSTDGCDSVVTTNVVLLPSDTVYVSAESCDPDDVGVTETLLSNQFGCDSLVVTTTGLLPSDTTYLQAITCDINQAGPSEETLVNQYGCDSLIITNTAFVPPDTTLLFAESCDPDEVGTEELLLQNTSGCDSLIITTTSLLPFDTVVLQAFSCDPGQVGTTTMLLSNIFGCDSLIITNTAQLPIDTTWLFFGTCLPQDTGLLVSQFSNQYGCDSLVYEQTDLLPASSCQLEALIQGDTIGCSTTSGSLWLTFLNGMPPYAYTWTDQNGNMGSGTIDQSGIPQQVSGLPPGDYTFEILDPDGLMTSLSAGIFQPDPVQIDLQVSSDFNGFEISCFGALDGSASVEVLSGGLPPYSFNWSNGGQTGQVSGLSEGWTSVSVTGSVGCEVIDSIFLESPDSLQFSLSVAHPDCFSDGLGAFFIDQVDGGSGPYRYSLNDSDWQDGPLFSDLASGSYLLEVEDANGCTASSFVFINTYIEPVVTLGQDTIVEYGDSLLLQPIINLPYSFLDSIYWEGLDCQDCPDVTVTPIVTSTYSVTVVDTLGCPANDDLQIFVRKDFDVYIPNVFSPNGDGINDQFFIFGDQQLVLIQELQIFDRWGEPVYTYFNLPPNDPTYGWDGTHRGELMNPAVYAYFAVLEFADGSTKLFKGDVLLMR